MVCARFNRDGTRLGVWYSCARDGWDGFGRKRSGQNGEKKALGSRGANDSARVPVEMSDEDHDSVQIARSRNTFSMAGTASGMLISCLRAGDASRAPHGERLRRPADVGVVHQ